MLTVRIEDTEDSENEKEVRALAKERDISFNAAAATLIKIGISRRRALGNYAFANPRGAAAQPAPKKKRAKKATTK